MILTDVADIEEECLHSDALFSVSGYSDSFYSFFIKKKKNPSGLNLNTDTSTDTPALHVFLRKKPTHTKKTRTLHSHCDNTLTPPCVKVLWMIVGPN